MLFGLGNGRILSSGLLFFEPLGVSGLGLFDGIIASYEVRNCAIFVSWTRIVGRWKSRFGMNWNTWFFCIGHANVVLLGVFIVNWCHGKGSN